MRLRQIALAAADCAAASAALCKALQTEICFHDPGVAAFGLENALMPLHQTFLEVVSPVRENAAAARWLRRNGDGGYMIILQCESAAAHAAAVARAKESGAQVVWETAQGGVYGTHFHPRELGAIVSLDAMPAWEEWHWAGPDWRANPATDITGVQLESPQPAALAARWAALTGLPLSTEAAGETLVFPGGGRLVFLPGAREGIRALEIRARRGVPAGEGAPVISGVQFVPGE